MTNFDSARQLLSEGDTAQALRLLITHLEKEKSSTGGPAQPFGAKVRQYEIQLPGASHFFPLCTRLAVHEGRLDLAEKWLNKLDAPNAGDLKLKDAIQAK